MQKRINDEKEALTFTPTLQTAKSQKRFKEVTGLKAKQVSDSDENGLSLLVQELEFQKNKKAQLMSKQAALRKEKSEAAFKVAAKEKKGLQYSPVL